MWTRSESFGEKRLGVQMLLFEIRIKNHREIADKDAAYPRSADLILRKENKSINTGNLKPVEFRREVGIEVDAELDVDFVLGNDSVAEQSADDRAANVIVV